MRRSQGFTLLEMSIVLIIIAIVAASSAAMFSSNLARSQERSTLARIEAIQQALLDYRRAFNRIPCPADVTLAISSNNFGLEAANAGSCTGGSPAANFTSGNHRLGLVPTKALKLPDDYAFDAWGSRIMYAVDSRATSQGAFTSIAITDTAARITVRRDSAGTQSTNQALYVLVSYGANKHGAYPHSGGASRNSVGSAITDEFINCDCDINGASTGFNANFLQKLPTESSGDLNANFDDLVRYATRAELRLTTE